MSSKASPDEERSAKRARNAEIERAEPLQALVDKQQELLNNITKHLDGFMNATQSSIPIISSAAIADSIVVRGSLGGTPYPGADPLILFLTEDLVASITEAGELFYYRELSKYDTKHMVANLLSMWMKVYVREHTTDPAVVARHSFYNAKSARLAESWIDKIEAFRTDPDALNLVLLSREMSLVVAENCPELKKFRNLTTGELY